MSKLTPNNKCEILINDFIGLAKAHLLTLKGQALCTTTTVAGVVVPSLANWSGYFCEPETPGEVTTLRDPVPTRFEGVTDLDIVEIEYYKDDIKQVYAESYPSEVISAPTFGSVKTLNSANTPNTSYVAAGIDARRIAEGYLGTQMTDADFNNLIAAIFAESGRNQTEEAHVAAVILNRTRKKYRNGNSVTDILYQPVQFEAVTGSPRNGWRPSQNFLNGPPRRNEVSIYGAIVNILSSVNKDIIKFTSNNDCLYVQCNAPQSGEKDIKYINGKVNELYGRDYDYLLSLRKTPGSIVVGSSIFSK